MGNLLKNGFQVVRIVRRHIMLGAGGHARHKGVDIVPFTLIQIVAEHADGINRGAATLGLLGLGHRVFGHVFVEATPARHAVGEDNDHPIAALALNRIQNTVGHLQAQIRKGTALRSQFANGSIQFGVIRVQQRLFVVLLRGIGSVRVILPPGVVGIGCPAYKHFGIEVTFIF